MPELRQNPISKAWVIIAPERGNRPDDFVEGSEREKMPEYNPECLFCPGNENLTPPEKLRHSDKDDNWLV